MLALVVSRRHGDDQCREERLLFARKFSSEGINRYRVIQINGKILPTEKLAYPFIAAALVDDEGHRIEPQRLSDHVVYQHGLSGSGGAGDHRVRCFVVEEVKGNRRAPPAKVKKHGPDRAVPVAKHGKSVGKIVRLPTALAYDKLVVGRIVGEGQ